MVAEPIELVVPPAGVAEKMIVAVGTGVVPCVRVAERDVVVPVVIV